MCSGKFCHQSILSTIYLFVTILYKIILWWFDQNLKRKRINTQPTLILMTKQKAGIYRTVRSESGGFAGRDLLGWNGPRTPQSWRTSNFKNCWDVRGRGRRGRRRSVEVWIFIQSSTDRSEQSVDPWREKGIKFDRQKANFHFIVKVEMFMFIMSP